MKNSNMERLCAQRKDLILSLERGEMNKEDFVTENYRLLEDIKYVDFEVTTEEEGILKYHYFNTMAKMRMMRADELEFRDSRESQKLKLEAYDFYQKKEHITRALLKFKDFQNMRAYYIDLNSKALQGTIFEIVLEDVEFAILHSKDRKTLYQLKQAGCFDETVKPSLIHNYVNTKL